MLAEKYMKMVWNGVAYNKYENLYNAIRKYVENNLQEQVIARAMTYSGYRSDNPSVQMYVEISATHDICEDIIKHEVKVVPNITCKKLGYPIYDKGELCDWAEYLL